MPGVVTCISAGDVPGANRRLFMNYTEELFATEEVLETARHVHVPREQGFFKTTKLSEISFQADTNE